MFRTGRARRRTNHVSQHAVVRTHLKSSQAHPDMGAWSDAHPWAAELEVARSKNGSQDLTLDFWRCICVYLEADELADSIIGQSAHTHRRLGTPNGEVVREYCTTAPGGHSHQAHTQYSSDRVVRGITGKKVCAAHRATTNEPARVRLETSTFPRPVPACDAA